MSKWGASKGERSWEQNYGDQRLSGIEFRRVKSNELVRFITIQHNEVLEKSTSFRVAIFVDDEDDTFTLPSKQTFEEMIQAKRRQQMLLYGPGNSSTNSSVLSDRAAKRVATAARRQSALNATISRQNERNLSQVSASPERPQTSSRAPSSKSEKIASKKRPTLPASNSRRVTTPKTSATTEQPRLQPETAPPIIPLSSSTSKVQPIRPIEVRTPDESFASDSSTSRSVNLITSMKELSRKTNYLDTIHKKEIKLLLKSAAPGAAIVLSNGIVVKKSRRGGARAGAGRKRSRPVTNGEIPQAGLSEEQKSSTSSSVNPVESKSIEPTSSSSSQPVASSSMLTY